MRNMEMNEAKFNLSYHCRECGHLVHGVPLTKAVYHISEHSDQFAYLVVRCPRDLCQLSFVEYDRLNSAVKRVFPYPKTTAGDFHTAIPESIRTDWAEAKRCWYGDSNKGVVTLSRRVMQAIALDKGIKGRNLQNQIKAMRTRGIITQSLYEAAQEIRHFGNFGAHPRKDGLDDVTNEDTQKILHLTEQFLVDLYVTPHKTAELLVKRTGAKNSAGASGQTK